MTMIRACLGALVIELIGSAALTLLCSQPRRWGLVARLGLSYGLGLVALTVPLFLASWCGLTPAWWFGVAELGILVTAAAVFRPQQCLAWLPDRSREGRPARRGWPTLAIVLTAFLLGLCVLVSAVSVNEPLVEWDVIAIWALKAKVLLNESLGASPAFHDVTRAYSHLDYPLLWPLAMSWVWSCAGQADLQAVKVLAPGLLFAMAATFFGLLRRRTTGETALLFTALLLGLPMVLSQISRLMPDPALAWFVLATFGCCYLWLDGEHPDDLRLAGVCAAGMLFTKNEGLVWFGVLLAMTMAAVVARRRYAQAAAVLQWLVVVPLALTAAWFLFRSGVPKVHEDYGSRLTIAGVVGNASRVPQIVRHSWTYLGDTEDWLAFWPLAALALLVTPRQWTRWPALFVALSAALVLAVYVCVYAVSPWNLDDLMEASANRLLLHLAPLCMFLLAEVLRTAQLLTTPVDPPRSRPG